MAPASTSEQGADSLLLQTALDSSRPCLELASQSTAAHSWLKQSLETGEGTDQVYNLLEKRMAQPEFLAKLAAAKGSAQDTSVCSAHGEEVLHASWWQMGPEEGPEGPDATDGFTRANKDPGPGHWSHGCTQLHRRGGGLDARVDAALLGKASGLSFCTSCACFEALPLACKVIAVPPEPLETGYVMVQKEDVLDAIGTFVATYLATLPEAQNLQPRELQLALVSTFQQLRKGRVRKLWEWGRCLYRCIAFSYGAFSVYENPWLVRALLAALWTSSRVLIGAIF